MPASWGHEDIVNKENKTYYKSIIVFTNRLRITAMTKNAVKICQNLNIYLYEEVKRW